jgi:hypothetical protein
MAECKWQIHTFNNETTRRLSGSILVLSDADIFTSVFEVYFVDNETATSIIIEDIDVFGFSNWISVVQPRNLQINK